MRLSASRISPTNVVVVVLPAEPVMPMMGAGHSSKKICASLLSLTPRRAGLQHDGQIDRHAAAQTQHIATLQQLKRMRAKYHLEAGNVLQTAQIDHFRAAERRSRSQRAPRAATNAARALPCRAAPRMTYRLPANIVVLPPALLIAKQRQRHTHHRRHDANQPKALHDLRLGPAEQHKVIVQWRHFEQPLAFTHLSFWSV